MNKIRLAFYKAKFPDGSIVDDGIALWTKLANWNTPRYSHVEVGFLLNGEWCYFSSTMRNKSQGTRWIDGAELLKNPDRWDVYEFGMFSDREIERMVEDCNRFEGKKYDLAGLLGFAFLPFFNSEQVWYCSEVCYKVITGAWEKTISPRGLYKWMVENFGVKLLVG